MNAEELYRTKAKLGWADGLVFGAFLMLEAVAEVVSPAVDATVIGSIIG